MIEAEHTALGKRVAVKLLKRRDAKQPMAVERLRVEAQVLARLTSPYLPSVSDLGWTPEGRPFFAMERLVGRSLLEEVRTRGALPIIEAVTFGRQLLEGLAVAHAAGLVHRDIKPENLFICEAQDGTRTLKLLDFGIAKVLPGADPERAPLPPGMRSQEGAILGTPRFIPPEQVVSDRIDARADLYGVGMVLYQMLSGRDPFHHLRGEAALLQASVRETPPAPSLVAPQPIPAALDAVVLRALAKRPEERFASAELFARALDDALPRQTEPYGWREGRWVTALVGLAIIVASVSLSAAMTLVLLNLG